MTTLERLTEAARIATLTYEREVATEKTLADEFTRCQLTASPAQFGERKSALEQKQLLVGAAFKAKLNAEAELDALRAASTARLYKCRKNIGHCRDEYSMQPSATVDS
jgi:hypothetical protein